MGNTSNKCYSCGPYEISNMCLESMPCKHYVTNTSVMLANDEPCLNLMNGLDIYRLYKSEGLTIPEHFQRYAELVRQQDFPTQDEINAAKQMKKDKDELIHKQNETHLKDIDLLEDNKRFASSSRLEKLKAKNNIKKEPAVPSSNLPCSQLRCSLYPAHPHAAQRG